MKPLTLERLFLEQENHLLGWDSHERDEAICDFPLFWLARTVADQKERDEATCHPSMRASHLSHVLPV
jgi:hypothetical protein